MDIRELKDLQKRVARAIDQYASRQKAEALQAMEAVAVKHGFSLSELTGAAVIKPRKSAEAKYANPDEPDQTWSGRGRKPRWVVSALENGKSLDELLIQA